MKEHPGRTSATTFVSVSRSARWPRDPIGPVRLHSGCDGVHLMVRYHQRLERIAAHEPGRRDQYSGREVTLRYPAADADIVHRGALRLRPELLGRPALLLNDVEVGDRRQLLRFAL